MKILNVNMTLDPIAGGGTTERTYQMSLALSRKGISCSILTLDVGLTDARRRSLEEVQLHTFPCISKRFYIPYISFRKLNQIIKDADVIHLMGHWTLLNAIVYLFCRRLNKAYVVCPAGALPIYGRSKYLKWFYNKMVGKKIIQQASTLISVTPDELQHFSAYGIDKNKVKVIPNGVNPEDYQLNPDNNILNDYSFADKPFILFLGRLNPIKGPDLLLKAFHKIHHQFPEHHLVYAGPDEGMLKELQIFVRENHIENHVHFIGYAGGSIKSALLKQALLLAIPSRSEAMSIVVLEAGIVATPVLATDQCGINEIEKINGGKIVAVNIEEIQNGLSHLLANASTLKTMGKNLQSYALDFTWNSLSKEYIKIFHNLTSLKGEYL